MIRPGSPIISGFDQETRLVIDVMLRLKIRHMAEGGTPQAAIAEKCQVGERSVRRILSEPEPTLAELSANARQDGPRMGRPPKADEGITEQVCKLLLDEPNLPATEVLRRSRAWGYTGSRSAMSALVKRLRPPPEAEPLVRFEGLPGEYVQFDFGECRVRFADGHEEKVIFFAGRLKYSRFMHVVLVPDQQSETLVRALIECLGAFGGSFAPSVRPPTGGTRASHPQGVGVRQPEDHPAVGVGGGAHGATPIHARPGGGISSDSDLLCTALRQPEGGAEGTRLPCGESLRRSEVGGAAGGVHEEQLPAGALVPGPRRPRRPARRVAARGEPRAAV